MPTRDQLTQERLYALIETLEKKGVLGSEECNGLCQTRDFGEAQQQAENASPGESVRREKISDGTHSAISDAYDNLQTARSNDDQQGQIDALEQIVDELTDVVTGDTLSEISSN